jgi:hypothetical protein
MSAPHVHHAHARTFRPRPPDCLLTAHLVCLHADKTASPGPGNYWRGSETDIGNDERRLQQWRTPVRRPIWWLRQTEAPGGAALFMHSLVNSASNNRAGCPSWPLPEDENGRPLTAPPSMLRRPGSSRSKLSLTRTKRGKNGTA